MQCTWKQRYAVENFSRWMSQLLLSLLLLHVLILQLHFTTTMCVAVQGEKAAWNWMEPPGQRLGDWKKVL